MPIHDEILLQGEAIYHTDKRHSMENVRVRQMALAAREKGARCFTGKKR
jgi:hypothetical protein